MRDMSVLLKSFSKESDAIFNKKYKTLYDSKKKKDRVMKYVRVVFFPLFYTFAILSKSFGKLLKMKVIGRPFRMLRAIFKILSLVKKVEHLERKISHLESEHSSLKRQWFNG